MLTIIKSINAETNPKNIANLVAVIIKNYQEIEDCITSNIENVEDEWVECCGVDIHLENLVFENYKMVEITAYPIVFSSKGHDTDINTMVKLIIDTHLAISLNI